MNAQPTLFEYADRKEFEHVEVLARSGASGLSRKAQKRFAELRLAQLKREMGRAQ